MKTTRRIFIKQSALAAVAGGSFGSLLWTEVGCAQDGATPPAKGVLDALQAPSLQEYLARNAGNDKTAEINRVPYISTYYVTPKVEVGKAVAINYYVTDYEQRDYMTDDGSATFTVEYWVNGAKSTLKNIKAGDNSFTLQKLPQGRVLLALQATDAQGRKSHRLFQEFLVVDPKEDAIPAAKVLSPDLKKFGIFNDDTHPVETTKGLTAMLKWASDNGYRKVLLPSGTYRLDENEPVRMATKLTLDMNGATFKLNPSALESIVMLEVAHCFDSHIVNGTFEGDWKERDAGKLAKSEHVRGVTLGQKANYCSVEDVKITNITGYGATTWMGETGSQNYVNAFKRILASSFLPGDIDEEGKPVETAERVTSDKPVDISAFQKAEGFLQLGRYLGYQGNNLAGVPGSVYGSWIYKAHFYDAQHNYLESIEGHLYRRLYLPEKAKFARFTLLRPQTTADALFGTFDFRMPMNCVFRNIHHENVRSVGMVPSGFYNLLVEGCTFEKCGFADAKCAFDAEDGWDSMQDLTFRNNVFGDNPHNEFVAVCGHNFVIENNVMEIFNNRRSKDVVVRNNKLKAANFTFAERGRTGCPRIYGNTIAGGATLVVSNSTLDKEYCIRDNVCGKGAGQSLTSGGQPVAHYYRCKISDGCFNATAMQCDLKNIENANGTFRMYRSTLEDSTLVISGPTQQALIADSTVKNTQLSNLNSTLILQGNTLIETSCIGGGSWTEGMEFVLVGNKASTSLEHLVAMGNSFKRVVLQENVITSSNPKFAALLLRNPLNKTAQSLSVALLKNTFNGQGGLALNVAMPPSGGTVLKVILAGNKYHGITEINTKATPASNIEISRNALS